MFQYDALILILQSGIPPDPGMTHFWNAGQPKPEMPEEARINVLMDELVASQDMAVRKRAYEEVERRS